MHIEYRLFQLYNRMECPISRGRSVGMIIYFVILLIGIIETDMGYWIQMFLKCNPDSFILFQWKYEKMIM